MKGRINTILGILLGCFLITWGIYLLPYSQPTLAHIFFRPLFWGLFSVMGGICANYHGFCRCVRQSGRLEDSFQEVPHVLRNHYRS